MRTGDGKFAKPCAPRTRVTGRPTGADVRRLTDRQVEETLRRLADKKEEQRGADDPD